MIIFKSLVGSSFTHPVLVYVQGIWVRLVCEGHWLKVKVTGAKMVKNFLFSMM